MAGVPEIYTKGLNRKGGYNQFRFENFKERVAMVDVDEGHRVRAEYEFAAAPVDGDAGSFLKDELYRQMMLEISRPFVSFSRRIAPQCQTLALVLHHKHDLATGMAEVLKTNASAVCWRSVLALVGALGK